jgi:hypothetical protein
VQASLAKTIELGRRVLELADKLRGDSGKERSPSFRIIAAQQLGATIGASSVWRAAAIYRLAQRFPELYQYEHVGVGHLSVLLSLREPLQPTLMRMAERLRWSRRQLESKVRRLAEERDKGLDPMVSLRAELRARGFEDELAPPG